MNLSIPFPGLGDALASHPLLLRLLVASVELLALAAIATAALALLRPRSARLRALVWLIVLAKPVVSLALGSPIAIVECSAPAPAAVVMPIATEVAPARAAAKGEADLAAATEKASAVAAAAFSEPVAMPAVAPGRGGAGIASPADLPATPGRRLVTTAFLIAAAWWLGVAAMLARTLLDRFRVARLVRSASAAEAPLVARAVALVRDAGRVRVPAVRRTRELASPALVGTWRPVLLVPAWMTDPRDLDWSLRHELMHFALRDPLAACVRELAQLLFFFHPAAWWAGRRWEEASELACDRAIVADEAESLDYADRLCAIAKVVVRRPAAPLRHGFAIARSQVARRLDALVRAPHGASSRLGRGGVTALALLALATFSLGGQLKQDAPASSTVAAAADDDVVRLAGRVLDPDGKPVAGAPVELLRYWWDVRIPHPPLAATTTDGDGRFTVTYRKSQFVVDLSHAEQWRHVLAASFVDGFGPGWDAAYERKEGEELTLRLVRDVPVRGRIVDLEGRPVVGVGLRVTSLQANQQEDLGPFLASLRAGDEGWRTYGPDFTSRFFVPPPEREWRAVSDAAGRFEIRGLGAHRVAHLEARGETIALLRTMLVTEPLEHPLAGDPQAGSDAQQIHGSTLELAAQPTQPIDGIVRAADTGEPLPDVEIYSWQFAGSMWGGEQFLATTTDEAGRFRLLGMPKGRGNQLYVRPNDDQPYFQRFAEAPARPSLEPVEMEIALDRGIWITGRVTVAGSGAPGRGNVHWLPYFSNPHMQTHPQLAPGGLSLDGEQRRFQVAPDGSYRVLGLPGPAVIGVTSVGGVREGVGWEAFAGEKAGPYGLTFSNPVAPGPKWPSTMARIDPPADATGATCDLVLDPGATIRVRCIDEASRSVADVEVCGAEPVGTWTPFPGESFVVKNLGPDEQRKVSIRHPSRKLGRLALLSLADGVEQTVTLLPSVRVSGRVLDSSGDPLARVQIGVWRDPSEDYDASSFRLFADGEGSFRCDDLLPGVDYKLFVENGLGVLMDVATLKETKPGQVFELGDVVAKPYQ